MHRLLLCVFVLLGAGVCRAQDDARQVLADAKRLEEQGDFSGALAKYIWFHDNALKSDPSLGGVRLSYALRDWIKLGKQYPEALERLKSIRDEKTEKIVASGS